MENGLIPKVIFAAEANDGFGSKEQEQKWNIKFNALFGLYKWSNDLLLTAVFSSELISNNFNDIHFNPRGVMWNESLAFFILHGFFHTEYGITHQCKHDIDNLSPPNHYSSTGNRVIVLSSLYGGIVSKKLELINRLSFRAYCKLHYNLFTDDTKIPEESENKNWKDIIGALYTGYKIEYCINDGVYVYNKNWYNPVLFSSKVGYENNYHLETGISIKGIKGGIDIYYGYEYFFDDISRPYSQKNQVHMAGVRLRSDLFK